MLKLVRAEPNKNNNNHDQRYVMLFFTGNQMRFSCDNCGIRTQNAGVCGHCLSLPRCKDCKRHLHERCFGKKNVCEVGLTIAVLLLVFYSDYSQKLHMQRTLVVVVGAIPICLFQACARKESRRRTYRRSSVNRIVNEISLSTNSSDTSFQTFVMRNGDEIGRIINNHQEHFGQLLHYCLLQMSRILPSRCLKLYS